MTAFNLIGQRFGKLLVESRIGAKHVNRQIYWKCLCDCGNTSEVRTSHLRKGKIVSCGCHRNEIARARSRTHGHGTKGIRTKTYRAWQSMIDRCTNPRTRCYKNYGGRGISVCERWIKNYSAFLADMGECSKHTSLDRIDVNGNYEPSNCRWATDAEQALNKRNNVYVYWCDRRITLKELSEATGVPYKKLHRRIRTLGWSVESAVIERPVEPSNEIN